MGASFERRDDVDDVPRAHLRSMEGVAQLQEPVMSWPSACQPAKSTFWFVVPSHQRHWRPAQSGTTNVVLDHEPLAVTPPADRIPAFVVAPVIVTEFPIAMLPTLSYAPPLAQGAAPSKVVLPVPSIRIEAQAPA